MKKTFKLIIILLTSSIVLNAGIATWTAAAGDYMFATAGNWNPASKPQDHDELIIDNVLIGFDVSFIAHSVKINNGLNVVMVPASAQTLTIESGGLINNGSVSFQLTVLTTGNQTWQIGSGDVAFTNRLDITSGVVTIDLGVGGTVNFNMSADNPNWNGSINFIGNVTDTSIVATGMGLTAQNIGKITINNQAVEKIGNYLTAIPEPSTYALIAGLLALVGVVAARRK